MNEKERYTSDLKSKFESYSSISNESWLLIKGNIQFQTLEKGEILLREGQISRKIYFICEGALRAFCADMNGNIYNKNLFLERNFALSTVSAIQKKPSAFTLEALEDCILISIDYQIYRDLIFANDDLKNFYIAYLERNWIIEKEQREVSLVLENATIRYLKFIQQYPDVDKRIPLQHIASHLGITPTQLSRIRKDLKIK
jgi:CRP-like cAMP-binding protein